MIVLQFKFNYNKIFTCRPLSVAHWPYKSNYNTTINQYAERNLKRYFK